MPLHRSTVLVLGAGASVPYNYPTGWELKNRLTTPSEQLKGMLLRLGHDAAAIEQLSRLLRRFGADSIDEFLGRYPEHSVLAKHAIAYEIIQCENIDTQLAVCRDNWYTFLFRQVLDDDSMLKGGLLKIITFNYDLSLEAHIHESLKVRHRLDDKQAADRMKALGLIHIYGDVGPIHAFHGTGRNFGRPVDGALKKEEIEVAASRITSITDPLSGDLINGALNTMRVAEDIVFVGFGWGSENVRRLNLREVAKNAQRIAATTVGIVDVDSIRSQLPVGPEFSHFITAACPAPTADMVKRLFESLKR